MSTIVRRNVDDLPETSRQTIEQMLGERLEAHQRVYIIVEAPVLSRSKTLRRREGARLHGLTPG